MEMELITSYQFLNNLIKNYFIKNVYSNNYILADAYKHYISEKRLYFISDEKNLVLFLDKGDFFQVYFLINDLTKHNKIKTDKPLVMEIIYRDQNARPDKVIDYWKSCGFKTHLKRIQMYTNSPRKFTDISKLIAVKKADSWDEVIFTKQTFDDELDHYTGDRMSLEMLREEVKSGNVLCSYFDNELAGALHFNFQNNILWLRHVAVSPKFRGKNVAKALVNAYFDEVKQTESTKFALWVIDNNSAAIKIYHDAGFGFNNKISLSLLRLKS